MALLAFPGTCKKKKPEVPPATSVPPPQTQPQPQTTQPTTTHPSEEKKTEEKPADTKPATKPKPRPTTTTTTTKKKPAPAPEMTKKPAPPATATIPQKTTPPAQNGENSGQLTVSLSNIEAARRRQETAQLLAVTDGELKGITRPLSSDEQSIVLQIRGYMQQSQKAEKDGDLELARNLAVKAKLLADDLAKR